MNGIEITQWRKTKSVSQGDLARDLNVSPRTLRRAESAEAVPDSISKAFDAIRTHSGLKAIQKELDQLLGESK